MRDRIPGMEQFSLYLHIPFCVKRCSYCDFNTFSGKGHLVDEYVGALGAEIRQLGVSAAAKYGGKAAAKTVYFGGGTPSMLGFDKTESLLQAVCDGFELRENAEITLEANPESVHPSAMKGLREAGVSRVSLGAQSFMDDELEVLGRMHTAQGTLEAVRCIREAGISNLSLDLIYGIPGQTTASWHASLEAALSQRPEHLSLYSLTVEPGTGLWEDVKAGVLSRPDMDLMADMYELAADALQRAGYQQYEISNWALPGEGMQGDAFPDYASRHNLQYWFNDFYIGAGAGAAGFAAGYRTLAEPNLEEYIRRMQAPPTGEFPFSPAVVEREVINRKREIEDTIMMGLRLTEVGLNLTRFQNRFGIGIEELYEGEIQELCDRHLLERIPGSLRLTPRGRLLGNQVFSVFIS